MSAEPEVPRKTFFASREGFYTQNELLCPRRSVFSGKTKVFWRCRRVLGGKMKVFWQRADAFRRQMKTFWDSQKVPLDESKTRDGYWVRSTVRSHQAACCQFDAVPLLRLPLELRHAIRNEIKTIVCSKGATSEKIRFAYRFNVWQICIHDTTQS
jgi:hypothetical protein